mmetsp:Transcript_29133/g.93919  ORF Transcript_29133/g.93919 Transcript_29133/m.93919 type:complete len:623 (-) Transcript_29133:412-2280(-)
MSPPPHARQLRSLLKELNQEHLFHNWPAKHSSEDEARFYKQLRELNDSYPGGLKAYVSNGRQLLAESKAGVNPLEGWTPELPVGETLTFGTKAYDEAEGDGLAHLSDGRCAFVLVAGGLGERLGYSGIKVELPSQLATGESYLEFYIKAILALQAGGKPLPLAIMTSGDTDAKTRDLLTRHGYFGMSPAQITIVKQEKVACLADNDGRLAPDPKDPFALLTKPHGHGDVHFLLHTSGALNSWLSAGVQWVYFFQDTNAAALRVLPATLGVSVQKKLEVNSVCVARRPNESIGGIMKLKHEDGRAMTANVEYNQIDSLLKSTTEPRGDVADASGFSPWPGSINQLLFSLPAYAEQLARSGGVMPEFVNPKYTDSTKNQFKSPTRLECLMQDYPKSLAPEARVGFTVVAGATTFSPVKTNLADARLKSVKGEPTYSAASGEADVYASACETLAACGVRLPPPGRALRSGVGVVDTPRVVIDPSFGRSLNAWRAKFITPSAVYLAPGSTLVMQGALESLKIQALTLQGSLVIRAVPGARVLIKRLRVQNTGWSFQELDPSNASEPEALAIRGYRLVKHQTRELVFDRPGVYTVDDGPLVPASAIAAAVAFVAAAIAGALYLLRRN